jgi:hypothetical protein
MTMTLAYHEISCPSGTYRLEFFGPRMDEHGYKLYQAAALEVLSQ